MAEFVVIVPIIFLLIYGGSFLIEDQQMRTMAKAAGLKSMLLKEGQTTNSGIPENFDDFEFYRKTQSSSESGNFQTNKLRIQRSDLDLAKYDYEMEGASEYNAINKGYSVGITATEAIWTPMKMSNFAIDDRAYIYKITSEVKIPYRSLTFGGLYLAFNNTLESIVERSTPNEYLFSKSIGFKNLNTGYHTKTYSNGSIMGFLLSKLKEENKNWGVTAGEFYSNLRHLVINKSYREENGQIFARLAGWISEQLTKFEFLSESELLEYLRDRSSRQLKMKKGFALNCPYNYGLSENCLDDGKYKVVIEIILATALAIEIVTFGGAKIGKDSVKEVTKETERLLLEESAKKMEDQIESEVAEKGQNNSDILNEDTLKSRAEKSTNDLSSKFIDFKIEDTLSEMWQSK